MNNSNDHQYLDTEHYGLHRSRKPIYPCSQEVNYLTTRLRSGRASAADLEHVRRVLLDSGFYQTATFKKARRRSKANA